MLLAKLFGTKSEREIKKLIPFVTEINQIFDSLKNKNDDELKNRTFELRGQVIHVSYTHLRAHETRGNLV